MKDTLKNDQAILANLTILYIEDEQNIRLNVTKTLELLCKKVISCPNAEEAYELYKNEPIDIIISDINLPGISGLELTKKIRLEESQIPIILLTAYTDTPLLLEAAKLKLVDYLTKPINFDNLNDALKRAEKEILQSSRYQLIFSNNTKYNLQQKILFDESDCEISLTNKEIMLLEYLVKNSHRVVSHNELKEQLWDDIMDATDSALKNVLNKLRKKIGKESISNISGVGFRIVL